MGRMQSMGGRMSKIDTLEQAFRDKVDAFITALEAQTIKVVVVCGRRTLAEQNALYAKGRTTPGPVVTNAKGGSSPHNFGLAVDLCPLKDGKPDWNAPDAIWKRMADTAKEYGLVPGYYFKSIHDAPHFEHPDWKTTQAKWKAGDITVV